MRTRVRSRAKIVGTALLSTVVPFNPKDLRLRITYLAPAELKPPRRAVKKHSKFAIERMERAIGEFGFLTPIVTDTDRRIIVGHRRWLAAKKLERDLVPVIEVSHLSEEQLRMFTILDNKLCEDSEWDLDELRVELAELTDLSLTLDFHIEDTGFSTAEIDDDGPSRPNRNCCHALGNGSSHRDCTIRELA